MVGLSFQTERLGNPNKATAAKRTVFRLFRGLFHYFARKTN